MEVIPVLIVTTVIEGGIGMEDIDVAIVLKVMIVIEVLLTTRIGGNTVEIENGQGIWGHPRVRVLAAIITL